MAIEYDETLLMSVAWDKLEKADKVIVDAEISYLELAAFQYLKDGTKPSPMPSFARLAPRNALVEGLLTVCAWLIAMTMGLALIAIFGALLGFTCALIGKAVLLVGGWLFR